MRRVCRVSKWSFYVGVAAQPASGGGWSGIVTKENFVKRRYLALLFPWLPLERLRATQQHLFDTRNDEPTVFVKKANNTVHLVALNAIAISQGLTLGMTLADARARCPHLIVFNAEPQADFDWLAQLANGCERYTPSVTLDPPDGLILDITGCLHGFDGERGLIADIAARLARRNIVARIASGHTPDAARAFARFYGTTPPAEGVALGQLPIAALGLDTDATMALCRVGLTTIGSLLERSLSGLSARFGAAAAVRLRQLTGETESPLVPRQRIAPVGVERHFAEPILSTDYTLKVLTELIGDAAEALALRRQGGRRFEARLFRTDGILHRLDTETAQPTRDVQLVMRLFRERIGTLIDPLDPGFGYDLIRLDVVVAEGLDALQLPLTGNAPMHGELVELIDRLSIRLGQGRMRRFVPHDSHIPELAERTLPAVAPRPPGDWPVPTTAEPPYRPIYLFNPPQPIDLILYETPDGPPKRFRWRRAIREVVRSEGPERIAGEWWRPGAAVPVRDYYRVEDWHGRRYWIFRHGSVGKTPPPWYLHGLFA